MRKIVLKLGVLFFLPFCFSCTEEDFIYKGDADLIVFGEPSGVFRVFEEKQINEMEVVVGVTRLSDVDREVIVQIAAPEIPGRMDAIQGVHFDIPDPVVVIPAGQWQGTLKIIGYFPYLPTGEDRVLNLRIIDEASQEVGMNLSYSLFLTKRCKADMTDFQGTFRFVESIHGFEKPSAGPVPTPLPEIDVEFTPGEKPDEFIIRAPYPQYSKADMRVVAKKDEATGDYILEVPDQFIMKAAEGANAPMFDLNVIGTGTWDACTKKLELLVTFHDPERGVIVPESPARFIKK